MYGQMTAGSWIYIGTQGILQGTYETLAELATQQFDGSLAGRVVVRQVSVGWGGPAAGRHDERRRRLCVEVDPTRIERRLEKAISTAPLNRSTKPSVGWPMRSRAKRAESIGLLGNAADLLPELDKRGFDPDMLPTRPRPTISSTVMFPPACRSTKPPNCGNDPELCE